MSLEKLSKKCVKGQDKKAFDITGEEFIGLYFSAHWCPPCRGFTPQLAEFYNKVKNDGQNFEIVFISSDRDEESFNEYFASMPWAALKFDERDAKQALAQEFGISGIPALIILNGKGEVVTKDGRGNVGKKMGEDKPSALSWS